jgi:hypothetical protein
MSADLLSKTRDFEKWVGTQVRIIGGDLRKKHDAMAKDPFSFLRATYYRWAGQFANLDDPIVSAPTVLAVGDLHVENYGTWRDEFGRLVWGINDFDEAFRLPFTNDLLRLAVSAMLAREEHNLHITDKGIYKAIDAGYRDGLATGGKAFIIGDEHRWFRPILRQPLRDPGKFWDKMHSLPRETTTIPSAAKAAIEELLPNVEYQLRHRIAGLGSLGKPRFTAITKWCGGPVAIEAKALTLSAAAWAAGKSDGPMYEQILTRAVRSRDPFLQVKPGWIVRRLSSDCRRLEIESLKNAKDQEWLIHAMAFEAANVHLGQDSARAAVARFMKGAQRNWLRNPAQTLYEMVGKDHRTWHRAA